MNCTLPISDPPPASFRVNLIGERVHVGVFIEFYSNNSSADDDDDDGDVGRVTNDWMVGKVHSINKEEKLIYVTEYPEFNCAKTSLNVHSGYFVNKSVTTYPGRLLREVAVSSEISKIRSSDVKAFCWVLSEEELKEPTFFHAAGMDHVYLLRFSLNSRPPTSPHETQIVSTVPPGSHLLFPPLAPSMMHLLPSWRIWHGIKAIQEALTRGLNRWSQKQKSHFNVVICFPSPETFWHIMHMVNHLVRLQQVPYRSSQVMVGSGLQKYKMPTSNTCKVLRFETHDQLRGFRSIFGATSLSGVREKAPTLQENHGKQVKENYIVHYVKGSGSVPENPYRNRTKRRGVDLRFDGVSHLKITVRFQTYVYQTDAAGKPINCPSQHLIHALSHYRRVADENEPDSVNGNNENENEKVEEDDDNSVSVLSVASSGINQRQNDEWSVASTATNNSLDSLLQPDTYFCFNDILLVITSVTRDHIYCVPRDNPVAVPVQYLKSNDEIREAIRSFN
jgi:hypothetical protein